MIYPGDVLVNVELQSQLDSDSIACSVETDTSCTAVITRDVSAITGDASTDTTGDVYTVTVTQTNDIDHTVNTYDFDGRAIPHAANGASNIHFNFLQQK